MHFQPVAKCDYKRWLAAPVISDIKIPADSELDQILVKELHAESRVIARRSAVRMRASTMTKVASKSRQTTGANVRQDATFKLHEAAKVGRSSEIANRTCVGISVTFERICKRVDVRTAEAEAQATKSLWCTKVVI
jgi:hypothetical protein